MRSSARWWGWDGAKRPSDGRRAQIPLLPERTPGLVDAGWHETAVELYTLEGAPALRAALASWCGGCVVVWQRGHADHVP